MEDIFEPGGIVPAGNPALSVGEQAIAGGLAMQQVKTGYTTAIAVQKPRDLADVERRLLQEAALGGEMMYYGWGAGKDRIEGPSWQLAVAAARSFGNCAIDQEPVQETRDAWIFTATFVDVETGFTIARQFRQSKKWTVHGKLDAERKDDMRFQIGQSKAIRNVVTSAVPKWLIAKAMQKAKEGVRAKLEKYIATHGIAAAIDYAVRAMAKHGVKPEAIAEKFSVAEVTALSLENLVTIKGDIAALDNGETRASELYPEPEQTTPATSADAFREPAADPPAKPATAKRTRSKTAKPEQADTLEQPETEAMPANDPKTSNSSDDTPPDVLLAEWRTYLAELNLDSLGQVKELRGMAAGIADPAVKAEVLAMLDAMAEQIRSSRGQRANGR